MIVLSLIAAAAGTSPTVQDRTLPPFPGRSAGSALSDCTLAGIKPGQPVPSKIRARAAGSTKVRIVHPGDQLTMDLIPSRRNIHVDAQGNVTGITCG